MASTDIIFSAEEITSSTSKVLINDAKETTTVSTIAIQSGTTRLVIALLRSGPFINLRILEMSPKLATIARNASDSEELLKTHEEVLEKLKNKRTPVEEMLRQADKDGPSKNRILFEAMKDSLESAWQEIKCTLDLRLQILKQATSFHKNRKTCLDYFEQVFENKKQVLVTYRHAVEDGRRLIEKLKLIPAEEQEEASYSIGLVYLWLDELQLNRFRWQDNLKSAANKEHQIFIVSEYERLIKEIEVQFENGSNRDEIRSHLLHLSSSVEKSEIVDSKKSHLQRLIFNLLERVTIVMELEDEVKAFLETHLILNDANFKHAYEGKLDLIKTFELKNADALKATLEKRLEARNNFERILENPLDYTDEQIQNSLNLDPDLNIASALERIQNAKNSSQRSLLDYLEDEMKDVEVQYMQLGNSVEKESEILNLKKKVEHIEDALDKTEIEIPKECTLLSRCKHFRDLLNRAEAVAKFLNDNNVLDSEKFKERYREMLSSDLCCQAEVANPLRDCVATRLEIQTKYDAMVENPTAFSEGHIETICNWDPTLDTKAAYEKLQLLRLQSKESAKIDNENKTYQELPLPVPSETLYKRTEQEIKEFRAEEHTILLEHLNTEQIVENEPNLHDSETQDQIGENERKRQLEEAERAEIARKEKLLQQIERENAEEELRQKVEELRRAETEQKRKLAEIERKAAAAEKKRQLEDIERQKAEEERKRELEELKLRAEEIRQRQLKEIEHQKGETKRQLEELEQRTEEARKQQVDEIERKEAEMKRKLEDFERQAEKERQRQAEELERKRGEIEQKLQMDELENQRQLAAELERQRLSKAENERLEQLRQANLTTENQNRELERKLQAELDLRRQELKNIELQRQAALELQRKQAELERQHQLALVEQRQLQERKLEADRKAAEEELLRKRLQCEREEQQRLEAEEIKKHEFEVLEAQKLREEHLEQLFKTLDFPLPENLATANSDLIDFQRFEAIVEEMDNPPLELIEKMYEKKNKIIQCQQFYELIQKKDRILFIREITKLEYELFHMSTISEQIKHEIEVKDAGNPLGNTTNESSAPNASFPASKQEYFAGPGGDYFSDNEVQTIFEQSTMQTQTAERDAKIIANSETQTLQIDSPEPIVLLMQEPAKLLSTTQTQTPVLPPEIDQSQLEPSKSNISVCTVPKSEVSNTSNDNVRYEELKPESPAKLLYSNETQTAAEAEQPELISKTQSYFHTESKMATETILPQNESKLLSDSITQTHEESPQLLRNTSVQTISIDQSKEPQLQDWETFSKLQRVKIPTEPATEPRVDDAANSERRPSVLEIIKALNSQIELENASARKSPTNRKSENVRDTNRPFQRSQESTPTPMGPVFTTTKRHFENYEEVITRRVEYPEHTGHRSQFQTLPAMEGRDGNAEIEGDKDDTLPRRKVKDFKKLFESASSPTEFESPANRPRTVPIQVEFPARGKVGQCRQIFENVDDTPLTPTPAYQISSIRQTSKYDAASRNYESNYSEHVSCHGVDSPMSPIGSPFVAFPESRPESAASNSFGIRRPTKFVPAKFTESDYESDYESFKIEPIWIPPSSRGSRPISAYEFRPASSCAKGFDYSRPKSTTQDKPEPPPKPSSTIAKPIAIKKPVPPPKPGKDKPDKFITDQTSFKVAEPISENLQRHKQLTTTLTKTEECKFYLRPVESPVQYDEELQVRKSVSPTRYVSVTSTPIHFSRARTDSPQLGSFYNKETLREERSWRSYDRERPESLEFAHILNQWESNPGLPASTEFQKTIHHSETGNKKLSQASMANERDSTENLKSDIEHEIKIMKE